MIAAGIGGAVTVEQATARLLGGVGPLGTESIAIENAFGRVLAEPLEALLTQPPFDASAMDGYAVRAADVASLPVSLAVIAEVAAGHPFTGHIGPGEAARIFTGAPIPDGADAIVIQENTRREGRIVEVTTGVTDREHVRPRGGDFACGERLLAAGTRLGARELTLAAAMGHGRVPVVRKPRVAILPTGDELVMPGSVPGPGQIVCSNHLGVAALARQAGGETDVLGIARDTQASLAAQLDRAGDADVLVTIGGASVGEHDLVQSTLRDRGLELDFWKIAMRPGKPLMYGRLGAMRILGLPGNPVSALVCARLFLMPLIAAMLGRSDRFEPISVRTRVALAANGPREHYMRAVLTSAQGRLEVEPLPSQDSSLLAPLARANAFLIRPIGAAAVPAGAEVPVLPLDF